MSKQVFNLHSRRLGFVFGASLSAIALCALVGTPLAAQDSAQASAAQGSGKWAGSIISLSSLRGAADIRVEPKGAKDSRAKITIRSAPINRQIAWDIVAGSCGDDGRSVAAGAAFRQLLTRNDGSGDAMATIPKLESGKRYYARVFDPGSTPSDLGGFGCTNLSEQP